MPRGAETYPEGRYYLNPKRGVPYQAAKNPDGRDWRLVFDPADYYDAWRNRAKDGPPLLVPASVLERPDWPHVVQAAQASQYRTVHPAILLARSMPDNFLRPEPGDQDFPYPQIDNPWGGVLEANPPALR